MLPYVSYLMFIERVTVFTFPHDGLREGFCVENYHSLAYVAPCRSLASEHP